MSPRTVTSRLDNGSDKTLTRKSLRVDWGKWTTEPPATIAPGSHGEWSTESTVWNQGTEGHVVYAVEGSDFTLDVWWDNPYVGSNKASMTPSAEARWLASWSITDEHHGDARFAYWGEDKPRPSPGPTQGPATPGPLTGTATPGKPNTYSPPDAHDIAVYLHDATNMSDTKPSLKLARDGSNATRDGISDTITMLLKDIIKYRKAHGVTIGNPSRTPDFSFTIYWTDVDPPPNPMDVRPWDLVAYFIDANPTGPDGGPGVRDLTVRFGVAAPPSTAAGMTFATAGVAGSPIVSEAFVNMNAPGTKLGRIVFHEIMHQKLDTRDKPVPGLPALPLTAPPGDAPIHYLNANGPPGISSPATTGNEMLTEIELKLMSLHLFDPVVLFTDWTMLPP